MRLERRVLGLAALIATAVAGMVYQHNPYNPVVFISAVALLSGAAMAATYVPARRAMKSSRPGRCGRSDEEDPGEPPASLTSERTDTAGLSAGGTERKGTSRVADPRERSLTPPRAVV